jgi:hypothetical protein
MIGQRQSTTLCQRRQPPIPFDVHRKSVLLGTIQISSLIVAEIYRGSQRSAALHSAQSYISKTINLMDYTNDSLIVNLIVTRGRTSGGRSGGVSKSEVPSSDIALDVAKLTGNDHGLAPHPATSMLPVYEHSPSEWRIFNLRRVTRTQIPSRTSSRAGPAYLVYDVAR